MLNYPIWEQSYKCLPGAQTRLRRHRHLLHKVHVVGEHLTEDQLEAIAKKQTSVLHVVDIVHFFILFMRIIYFIARKNT